MNVQGGTYGLNIDHQNPISLFKITDTPGDVSRGGDNREVIFQNLVVELGGSCQFGVDTLFDFSATIVPCQVYIKNVLNGAPNNKYFLKTIGTSPFASVNVYLEGYNGYTSAAALTSIGEYTNITINSVNYQQDLSVSLLFTGIIHPVTSSIKILSFKDVYNIDTSSIISKSGKYTLPALSGGNSDLQFETASKAILLTSPSGSNYAYNFDMLAQYIQSFGEGYMSGHIKILFKSASPAANYCHIRPFGSFVGGGIQSTNNTLEVDVYSILWKGVRFQP